MCLPFVFFKIWKFSLWHSYRDTLYIQSNMLWNKETEIKMDFFKNQFQVKSLRSQLTTPPDIYGVCPSCCPPGCIGRLPRWRILDKVVPPVWPSPTWRHHTTCGRENSQINTALRSPHICDFLCQLESVN